uniref:Uncharacterized protein n=1 Tax=Rhizophora mucronata TaxID=61149 RepID=A0A2P2LHR5_RHIMU
MLPECLNLTKKTERMYLFCILQSSTWLFPLSNHYLMILCMQFSAEDQVGAFFCMENLYASAVSLTNSVVKLFPISSL